MTSDELKYRTIPYYCTSTKLINQNLFHEILLNRTVMSFLFNGRLMAAYADEGLWHGNDTEIGF